MPSCILYHGPGAQQAALAEALRLGDLMAPPFGADGLTVAEAREIVELLHSAPVGDRLGVVVIGPLDSTAGTTGKATDALLKSLEEVPSVYVQPVLWADDLGGVPRTIRSRCLERWALLLVGEEEDEIYHTAAWTLVGASLSGDYATLIGTLDGALKRGTRSKGDADSEEAAEVGAAENSSKHLIYLIQALADVLATELTDSGKRSLWARLQHCARWRNPTRMELLAALVGVE